MAVATERTEAIKKLRDLIKGINIAMLTTVDESDGTLRSRPMGTQQVEFDGDLWFFTRASAPKVGEVEREQQVNVSYADAGHNRYVSVSGTAHLVRDRKKNQELWNHLFKDWFPEGLDDPDLALLRVAVEKAEYWDSPSGKLVALAGFVKAIATGAPIEGGENEKLEL
jgi:general stress protein 26